MISLAAILPAVALTRYDDDGEPQLRAGERVLVALRRLGWVTRRELNEALGLGYDADDRAALDAVTIGLRDGVRAKKIDRRDAGGVREYRINAAAFATKRAGRGGRKRAA